MVTFEMYPPLGGLIHWIQSVYVMPEFRKNGAFRKLYNHVCEVAKNDPLGKVVRLYVDTDNLSAMAVYEKLGMSKMDNFAFDEKDFMF
mmetsp:Transcript_5620/g.4006  ORF Transcript_5620/g.4006 Transcript_5620/m.4006 type:complete len:88 (+) Transcript_5620:227-490(+)